MDTPKQANAEHNLTTVMDATRYQELAGRTECDQAKSRMRFMGEASYDVSDRSPPDFRPVRVNHAVLGLAGEVGELATATERWLYYGKGPLDVENVAEEVGDCLWYLALVCNACGLSMSVVMRQNLAKLRKRYPDKYTDQHALNRNPEAEAEAMRRAAVPHPMSPSFPERNNQSQEEALSKLPGYKERRKATDLKADREQQEASFQDGHGFGHTDEKEGDSNG